VQLEPDRLNFRPEMLEFVTMVARVALGATLRSLRLRLSLLAILLGRIDSRPLSLGLIAVRHGARASPNSSRRWRSAAKGVMGGCVLRIVLLVSLGCALGCSSSTEPAPQEPGEFDRFDQAVEEQMAKHGLAGATAFIVTKDDGVVHMRGYGAFDVDRVMFIASSSKILSVGILMRLADQGLLDVDAPISSHLADWGMYKTDISVAQLVSNSSGMIGILDNALYAPYLCMFLDSGTLAECGEAIYTADDAADRIPPDTEFHYGGGQWQLAGSIAEVVSGKTWAQLFDETYLQPCGLATSGFHNPFAKSFAAGGEDAARQYPTWFNGDPASLTPTANPNIEGGAYANAADYAKILWMHLRGGTCDDAPVLSAEAVARMQEDRIGEVYDGVSVDPTLPGYGMGWFRDRTRHVVGDAGAYGAMPWLDVDRGYGAMFLIEDEAIVGVQMRLAIQPLVEELIDARAAR
jgi:CubicO group peptidase (beta-lactamase class C family)